MSYSNKANELLKLFEVNIDNSESFIERKTFSSILKYSECVQGNYDAIESGYFLWFEWDIRSEFEKQTGKTYIDEVFIPINQLV